MKTLVAFALLICWFSVTVAQDRDSTRVDIFTDLEQAFEEYDPSDPETNNEQLVQYLQDLADRPVNINTAGLNQLLVVPGLNLKKARAIIVYREKNKPFEQVDELIDVPGIGSVTLRDIYPYVTVGEGMGFRKMLYSDYKYWTARGQAEVFSRYQRTLQSREGYVRSDTAGGYVGGPTKYYQRVRYHSDHLSVNLTQEKDPGEPLNSPADFDHTTWHLAIEDNGKLHDLVIGDYSLAFGQGLVLWNGGGFGKGRNVINAMSKNERGVAAYSSAQESNYLRGVAGTYGGQLQASGFYSFRKQTASVIQPDTVRFPSSNGYHRTARERNRRHNTRQELYGGRLRLELPFGFMGATAYRTVFDKYIQRGAALYNRYDFEGIYTSAIGIDYRFLLGPALMFGEAGRSQNGGYGVINGVESAVGTGTDVTLGYRNYSRNFQSIMGSGFGESSGEPQNEEGIYLGVQQVVSPKVVLSGYVDQYRFPAPRFGTYQSTKGIDWLGVVEVDFNRNTSIYLQVRSERREEEYELKGTTGRMSRLLGNTLRSGIRLHVEHWVNSNVRLRTRGEGVRVRKAGASAEYGYLLYQDLRLIPAASWKIDIRATVFETESYDSRLYQFENDLLYVLSNQMLYESGQRLYLLVNCEPFDFMEIWAKMGLTVYENRQIIGSGLDEIEGNRRSDIGLQVRFQF